MSTASRYQHLRSELDEECNKAGRNPQEVLLLAVSKTVDLDQVALAIEAGRQHLAKIAPMNYCVNLLPFLRWSGILLAIFNHVEFLILFLRLPLSIRYAKKRIFQR